MRSKPFYLICVAIMLVFAISSCSKSNTNPGVTLVSPANNSTNIVSGQLFTCTAVTGAVGYEFEFTDTQTGAFVNQIMTSNSFSPTSLVSGHSYHWHVHVALSNNTTQDSPVWTFTMQ